MWQRRSQKGERDQNCLQVLLTFRLFEPMFVEHIFPKLNFLRPPVIHAIRIYRFGHIFERVNKKK